MTRTRCDRTPAWAQLHAAYQASGKDFDLRDAFAADPQRFVQFSQAAPLVLGGHRQVVDPAAVPIGGKRVRTWKIAARC